jgi:hypothetical protein
MPLKITRLENESWEDCARRYARPHGLELEVMENFRAAIARGENEDQAAFDACYEWDLTEWTPH